jgi:nitroreductase
MDAIDALLNRSSSPILTSPGPTEEHLQLLFRAALKAPDHARLRPWRFLIITDNHRNKLGEVFAKAISLKNNRELSEQEQQRYQQLPMRAPTIVAPICCIHKHKKVPEIEQMLSLAAGVQSMLLMAFTLDIGAYWRTGELCYNDFVANKLGLSATEKLCGFVYLGTKAGKNAPKEELNIEDFTSYWGNNTKF